MMDYKQLCLAMPHLAQLSESGCDGADTILVRLDGTDVNVSETNYIDALARTYGEALFPEQFGDDELVATRIQFDDQGHATVVYEMTDNNYAALGVTFDGVLPVALHYNDRSYPVGLSGGYSDLQQVVTQILNKLSVRWSGNDPADTDWEKYTPFKDNRTWPPIVDPRLGLTQEDAPGEYAVMMAIRALLRVYSPTSEDHLFNSEVPGYDITAPSFALRTYDRHSSDYSHTWNFVWRDFAVQWYGRFDRDPTFNRRLSSDEVVQLMDDVIAYIQARENWPKEPVPPKPMNRESLERMHAKLQRNGRSGAF